MKTEAAIRKRLDKIIESNNRYNEKYPGCQPWREEIKILRWVLNIKEGV